MRTEFGQMLDSGRHIFDTAANAFLGGTDLEVIREDLFATDKRINRAERQIRAAIRALSDGEHHARDGFNIHSVIKSMRKRQFFHNRGVTGSSEDVISFSHHL